MNGRAHEIRINKSVRNQEVIGPLRGGVGLTQNPTGVRHAVLGVRIQRVDRKPSGVVANVLGDLIAVVLTVQNPCAL